VDALPGFAVTFGDVDVFACAKAHRVRGSRVGCADGLAPRFEAAFAERGMHVVTVPSDQLVNLWVLVEALRADATGAAHACDTV
jgi:thiamine pyrophosphate-dependent acetolactate synthase large subunit-like protein